MTTENETPAVPAAQEPAIHHLPEHIRAADFILQALKGGFNVFTVAVDPAGSSSWICHNGEGISFPSMAYAGTLLSSEAMRLVNERSRQNVAAAMKAQAEQQAAAERLASATQAEQQAAPEAQPAL